MGCRTQAWALVQATAYSAWACMAARTVRRRKVCGAAAAAAGGAAPQDVELLKALEPADGVPGPAELHMVGLDPEGPYRKNAGR